MASEPFEVTDDKGNTVTGTVDVFRDPNGPYFDPGSEYYMHPRYADAHFDYFNTREACTIDRDTLSRVMQDALAKALTRFGIKEPAPNPAKIAKDVNASIDATRQQCIRNADKYVSNETFSSSNWETDEAVGNLTAKAYVAVPAPDGSIQTVVARENSWPAADLSALKNYDGADARVLSRRVIARNGGNTVESRGSSSEGIVPRNPTQQAPPPYVSGVAGISDSVKPMRYVSRRDGYTPPPSVSNTGAPAAQFVLPDQLNTVGGRTDWATALASRGPLNPMQAAPPLQAGETPGISSNNPVPILSRVIADRPQASVVETSGSAVPFAPSNEVFSPARGNAFAAGSGASLLAGGAGGSSMPGLQGSSASTLLEYIRHLNQLSANKLQVPAVDPDSPGASLAPSDSPTPMGGLAGRIAALAGIDPDNPDRPVPPPGGLLALLLAAQQQ
jgi:hypothetical protein